MSLAVHSLACALRPREGGKEERICEPHDPLLSSLLRFDDRLIESRRPNVAPLPVLFRQVYPEHEQRPEGDEAEHAKHEVGHEAVALHAEALERAVAALAAAAVRVVRA